IYTKSRLPIRMLPEASVAAARIRRLPPLTLPLRGILPRPAGRRERGEGWGVYEPGRLVTELTGWIGDRFGLSAGGACRCHGERPVRWTNGCSLSLGFWPAGMR